MGFIDIIMEKLYHNIGRKIKIFAVWSAIIEAVGAVITGIVLLSSDADFLPWALLTIFFGPVVAYVNTWFLYAFGELVESCHQIRSSVKKIAENSRTETTASPQPETPSSSFKKTPSAPKSYGASEAFSHPKEVQEAYKYGKISLSEFNEQMKKFYASGNPAMSSGAADNANSETPEETEQLTTREAVMDAYYANKISREDCQKRIAALKENMESK